MTRFQVLWFALAILLSAAALRARPSGDDDLPPVFDKRPYADAKAAAVASEKWFIVKATASWCMPCKQMDKTTWRDDDVVKWLTANAIAVQVDVDQEKKLAQQLGIQAMPTMIAFKKGETEFDRVVGYKSPAEFRAWLQGIAKGEKSIEAIKRRAAAQPAGGKEEVDARYDLARSLVQSREFDKATDEYAWLWVNSLDVPGYGGVRGSFMAGDMKRLAATHTGAKKKFTEFRDEKATALTKEKIDPDDLDDWIVLNDVVGEPERTLEWFDKIKTDRRYAPLISRSSFRLEHLLIENDRWADLGNLYPDPMESLDRDFAILKMTSDRPIPEGIPEAQKKEMLDISSRLFREKAARMYAGLLAAGRENDAAAFAAKSREMVSTPEMLLALVRTALEAKQPRPAHLDWLQTLGNNEKAAALLKQVQSDLDRAKK